MVAVIIKQPGAIDTGDRYLRNNSGSTKYPENENTGNKLVNKYL
jgi:hypothetical protein